MKYILVLLLFLVRPVLDLAQSWDGVGLPVSTLADSPDDAALTTLTKSAYTVSYSNKTHCPVWVAWILTAEKVNGTIKRMSNNAWHEELDLPAPRSTPADYYNLKSLGLSRGHICPAGDNKWDSVAMYESFSMANVCPQNGPLNGGDWNEIEMACRRWATAFDVVYIVSGPVFSSDSCATIGKSKIAVPDAFYKVIIRLGKSPASLAFVCPNNGENHAMDFYLTSIADVERMTGLAFFPDLPADLASSLKSSSSLKSWDKKSRRSKNQHPSKPDRR